MPLATLLVFLLLRHTGQSLTPKPLGVLVSLPSTSFLQGLTWLAPSCQSGHQRPGPPQWPSLTAAGRESCGLSLLHYLRELPAKPSALSEMTSVLDCIIQRWPQKYPLPTCCSRTSGAASDPSLLEQGQSCDLLLTKVTSEAGSGKATQLPPAAYPFPQMFAFGALSHGVRIQEPGSCHAVGKPRPQEKAECGRSSINSQICK